MQRRYLLQAQTAEGCRRWVQDLRDAIAEQLTLGVDDAANRKRAERKGADAAAANAAAGAAGGGIPHFPPFPPPAYPAVAAPLDTATRGSWLGRYGGAGYYLFAFDNATGGATTGDVAKLPPWVAGVTVFRGAFAGVTRTHVGTTATNATYLEDPRDPGGRRALGLLGQCSEGSQGTVVDVNVTDTGRLRRVSFYMVGAALNAAQAVRIMDLDTLNVVSPTPSLGSEDLKGGAWVSLSYTRGVRLRVMNVWGAYISALAFD